MPPPPHITVHYLSRMYAPLLAGGGQPPSSAVLVHDAAAAAAPPAAQSASWRACGGGPPSAGLPLGFQVEQWGDQTLPAERTVVVFPSFSHSSHVASHTDDPTPGWWEGIVGPGKAIDTNVFRVICATNLGSPYAPISPASASLWAGTSSTSGSGSGSSAPSQLNNGNRANAVRKASSAIPADVNPSLCAPQGSAFPQLTPADQARAVEMLLRMAPEEGGLGLTGTLFAVVGSSFGGMQALQFASLFPRQAHKLVAISCTGRSSPFTVAVRSLQRRAILWSLEEDAAHGITHGSRMAGLQLARQLGTLFYRSREEFDRRFDWKPTCYPVSAPASALDPVADPSAPSPAGASLPPHRAPSTCHFTRLGGTWEVESYLTYQGSKFAGTYDPYCYLLLSKCMDLQDLGDGVSGRHSFADGVRRIAADALLIGVQQDALIPAHELRDLADMVRSARGLPSMREEEEAEEAGRATASSDSDDPTRSGDREDGKGASQRGPGCTYLELNSIYGHDAFLKEFAWLGPRVKEHLERDMDLLPLPSTPVAAVEAPAAGAVLQ